MNDPENPLERSRDPKMLAWFRLVRVMKKIFRQMDTGMRDFDLSRYQFELLMEIAFQPGINQQHCANEMNVSKGNVTQHLDRLEEEGLVERTRVGRENTLHLTAAGKRLVAEIMPLHDAQVREILASLTDEEVRQFQAVLRKLDRSLD